ncbi:hypothetical protein AMK59_1383 [Oryctes borbonicus]|uniref:RanBP2-type domain-containing protein n=1 Tax=Oryctes borbonicus TaxID=1629725 RepID=A0A0T6BHW9_9SCAR|nr:hypothetical protein AMK59_1383 [Oryctes borbonicus]
MPIAPALVSSSQCIHNNGYYPNNYTTYGIVPPVYNFPSPNVYGHITKQPYSGNYYCNGYVPQTCVVPVPTGQLIEIEPPPRPSYDINDSISKSQKANYSSDEIYNKDTTDSKINSPPKTYDKDEVTGTFESWDYVYRNLESQGYSKDLGERGDVLGVNRKEIKQKEHELKVSDRPLKITEALEKIRIQDKTKKPDNTERKASTDTLSSSYDNLSTHELCRRATTNVRNKFTSVVPNVEESESQGRQISKTLDLKKLKSNQTKSKPLETKQTLKNTETSRGNENLKAPDSDKWQCSSCTYLNNNSKKICDICSKSRVVINQEMEIGGSECSKCTLVNPKNNKKCEACNSTLQNSPTYI